MFSSFGFGAPLILMALVVLPVIWFLLRITPPRPQHEPFAPLKILLPLMSEEKTAQKSPWWLVLLRLLMAGLIIFALSQPVMRPRSLLLSQQDALVLMIDNGFAAAPQWQSHIENARKLIIEAGSRRMPVTIIATADPVNDTHTSNAAEALEILDALRPHPLGVDRLRAIEKLRKIESGYQLVYLTDGLATQDDKAAFAQLALFEIKSLLWYQEALDDLVGLSAMENRAQSLYVEAIRANSAELTRHSVAAYDQHGRRLGEAEMIFAAGENHAQTEFTLPLEMRNDIVMLQLENMPHAGATRLVSSSDKRQRIALFGGMMEDGLQPLLSPLYYPKRALAPFGDLIEPAQMKMAPDILLDAKPTLLVLADSVRFPASSRQKLDAWLEAGGTLLRFAGLRLAASEMDDDLLPVRLRRGERSMGGAMSWVRPQKIAAISRQSPFFGLEIPDNVTVSRQVLAVPEPQLFDKSWVTLEDGTPLVTAQSRGRGRIIFVHTTATPDWSNLALSGFFVEMMQRIVLTTSQPILIKDDNAGVSSASTALLSPWRTLSAEGNLQSPPGFVLPLDVAKTGRNRPDFNHLPGLYGLEEPRTALNLLQEDDRFEPLEPPLIPNLLLQNYTGEDNLPLAGFLWAIAVILFTIDCLIRMVQSWKKHGQGRRFSFKKWKMSTITGLFLLTFCFILPTHLTWAQIQKIDDQILVERAAKTHLAYVKTGNSDLDNLSQAGLDALSLFISGRTTIDLGEAVAIDLAEDELGFYPLLYWPVDAATQLPTDQAIARLDAYMHQGGTVLFDTRDQLESGLNLDGEPTANMAHLRLLLGQLDIAPLEPAPPDHVVARSFYIMPDFPGRYRGAPLWVEALPISEDFFANEDSPARSTPIVRAGDGVSPILVTANDFIGAWAQTATHDWFYPTVPDEPSQRLWAFRGGLNIVMYLLSGNYKADQVHAPELLRRLGE